MKLQTRIDNVYETLNVTDRRILNAISEDPGFFACASMVTAASRCSVSRATFLRAIRKAGIESFASLKYLCREESGKQSAEKWQNTSEIFREYESILQHLLLHSSFEKQAELVLMSQRIFLYGTGNEQKSIVRYLKTRLLQTGFLCVEIFDEGEAEFFRSSLQKDDLVIFVSLSGTSSSLLKLVRRMKRASTMSLTRLRDNPLSHACDEQLYVSTASVLEGQYELVGAFYTLVDLLCAALGKILKKYEEDSGRKAENPKRNLADSRLREKIMQSITGFSDTDRSIAAALLKDEQKLMQLSISECARKLFVSPSALSRFAMKLGCSGFAELRALSQNGSSAHRNRDLCLDWYRGYQLLFSAFEQPDFHPLLDRVQLAGRFFFLSPHSRHITLASEMMRMFLPLDRTLYFYSGEEALRLLPEQIQPDDVIFILAPDGYEERSAEFLKQTDLSHAFRCVLTSFAPFLSEKQPDLLLQAPGTEHGQYGQSQGPFYVLAELLFLQCRTSM